MTTYKIPTEPDGPVWLFDPMHGSVQRVTRTEPGWWSFGDGDTFAWADLLALGKVSDTHPDLPAGAPLPWQVDAHLVVDANGDYLFDVGSGLTRFVVEAVNAYGERVTGGGSLHAERALEQARAAHDEAEAEAARLNAELSDVPGEVRALLLGGPGVSSEAREALRARLACA